MIDPFMAADLRAIGLRWRQVGVVLAVYANRPVPYTPTAIHASIRRHEVPQTARVWRPQ